MKHLRRFNENAVLHATRQENKDWSRLRQEHPNASDEQIDMMVGLKGEEEEIPSRSEEALFNMEQLEAAFLSARVSDSKGNPRFKDFRDWYMSELGSSIDMRDHAFDKHTKFPYAR